jgi:hypothetical protein
MQNAGRMSFFLKRVKVESLFFSSFPVEKLTIDYVNFIKIVMDDCRIVCFTY